MLGRYINAGSELLKKTVIDSAKNFLYESILNKLIPHWYGTLCDFNGYTSKPGEGVIACGYFVSTLLRDAGFNLNRYDLAKQSPVNEAISINLSDNIISYNNLTVKNF